MSQRGEDEVRMVASMAPVPDPFAHDLWDDEMGALKRVLPLPPAQHQPPSWQFPPGYPSPSPLVRALHLGKLVALLEPTDGAWLPTLVLRGGI